MTLPNKLIEADGFPYGEAIALARGRYHGFGHPRLPPFRLLQRPQLNSGTLARRRFVNRWTC